MSPPVLYDGRFMQLNPARGRKPSRHYGRITLESNEVYAAQPREGTETLQASSHLWWFPRFMQLNPARGRKLSECGAHHWYSVHGLCSSTPRGDGNLKKDREDYEEWML